jgi:hypothetical protein
LCNPSRLATSEGRKRAETGTETANILHLMKTDRLVSAAAVTAAAAAAMAMMSHDMEEIRGDIWRIQKYVWPVG